ncbi:MAG: alkaline phosphatase family protein [Solirubrobacteraceae bacterium]
MLDATQSATAADEYATRHDPFVYFHSIIDDTTLCDTHVVNLDLLSRDLRSTRDTPNYVFITPDLCDDGHDASCANGSPGGLPRADRFLREWVPKITAAPAYRSANGLLLILFDEASTSDTRSCCGEIPGPGSLLPGFLGSGGGDTGAVALSPCIAPGTVSPVPYNHYSMLRSVEDIFGLRHLGYAALPGESSFGADIFTRRCPARVRSLDRARHRARPRHHRRRPRR